MLWETKNEKINSFLDIDHKGWYNVIDWCIYDIISTFVVNVEEAVILFVFCLS